MRNILKKSLFIALGCLVTSAVWATSIADLNFQITSTTTAVPSNYTYSASNTPSIKTQNGIKCIIISDGGGSNAPTFNGSSAPSGGKRWMAFSPDVDCSVTIGIMSNKKEFYIQNADGKFFTYTNTANAVEEQTVKGLKAGKWYAMCGGSSQVYVTKMTFTAAGPAPKSTDATLSDLQVDGVTVDGFSSSVTSYNYTIPATATSMPSVTATKHDSKASDPVITQASMPTVGNPTQATVVVTAEDGTTTQTYTITFTRAELSHDATLKAIMVDGTAISGFVPATKDYTISIPYSQTTIPVVTATVNFSAATYVITPAASVTGSASILVTAEDGTTQETYTVTFQKAAPSTDATLKSLSYNGIAIPNFSSTQTTYTVQLQSGTAIPVLAGEATHTFATIVYQQISSLNGNATATVTAEDGTTTKTYTVTFEEVVGPPVPHTTLTLHAPEVYEAKEIAGGYGGTLSVVNGREYEVYYAGRDSEGDNINYCIVPTNKGNGITKDEQETSCKAKDGWFNVNCSGVSSNKNLSKMDEFNLSPIPKPGKTNEYDGVTYHTVTGDGQGSKDNYITKTYLEFHVQGYDEFAFVAADKDQDTAKVDKKRFIKVYIDDVRQPMTLSTTPTVRRFSITTGEHVIRIVSQSYGSDKNSFYGFSLRLAEEPRVKYIDGNDSTQIVYQTQEVAPIYYYTKYNSKGRTGLIWDDAKATGLDLTTYGSDQLGDTLVLGGPANCAVGVYSYHVVSYNSSNQETSSVPGKIKVETLLRPSSRDSVFDAFTGEEMDQIVFSYYALNPENDITLTWNGASPGNNVKGDVSGNKYIIHGVPADAGSFKFTVSIAGGNSINGELKVTSIDLSDHPVMYLYKNSGAYDRDGVYQYLTSGVPNKLANLIPRKAQETGTRDSYSKYDWILISNDVDADNPEVLALIKDNIANKPILNMQGFTYTADRLNWGEPNNGTMDTISKNGCNIFIQQPNHPIFANIVYTQGTGKLQVLNSADKKSVMPININNCPGSLCLATAYTRDIDEYYKDGEMQTIIHEVPFTKRGGKKYICFPLVNTKDNLTNEGKLLLKNIVTYLTNTTSSVALPELEMQSFIVHGYTAQIDQEKDLITLELTEEQFEEADSLSAEKPIITVKDSKTHVLPAADEELDLRYTTFLPKTFVVTDYINRRVYSFKLIVKRPQGIDEVYTAGQWVNIFDIYGRKIATTNEDVYTMELPHGMYIVVTENGGTIKIMR